MGETEPRVRKQQPLRPTKDLLSKRSIMANSVSVAENYFQPISAFKYYGRAKDVYLNNLDTFLGFTLAAAILPMIFYQKLDPKDYSRAYIFKFLLIPAAQLFVEASSVWAVAMTYANAKPDWSACMRQAQSYFGGLWLIELFKSLGGALLTPLGVFTFSLQILLLEQRGMVGSLKGSIGMVFSSALSNFSTVLFLGLIVCPLLRGLMNLACALFIGTAREDMQEFRYQIQSMLVQPLLTCVWTVFYFDVRIRKGLTREQLQRSLGLTVTGSSTSSARRNATNPLL